MQPRIGSRLSGIVRAAAVEMAGAPPAPPPAPTEPAPAPSPAPTFVPVAVPKPEDIAAKQDAQAMREMLVALTRQVAELRGRRVQSMADVSRLSVDLAVTLTERLLRTEIAADRQRLDCIVQGALARLPAAHAVTVRGHANDMALLDKQLAGNDELPRDALTLRKDATLPRGRIVLEAGDFFVEWDTAKCLAELRAALDEANLTDA